LEENAAFIFTVKVTQVGEMDGYTEETRKKNCSCTITHQEITQINRYKTILSTATAMKT
jgi:hypothetical protein